MSELTKLETLQKNVADTKAAWCDDKAAFDYSFNKAAWDATTYAAVYAAIDDYIAYAEDAEDAAADAAYAIYTAATYDAWSKAKRELNNYLKEQDNEKLERLQKAVVDADAAVDAAFAIYRVRCCTADRAFQELNSLEDYLKEQDNE
tara:strand:+ start:170 stop:610 length:441 start_codon:yes stop_codon:yes gene_type:complete